MVGRMGEAIEGDFKKTSRFFVISKLVSLNSISQNLKEKTRVGGWVYICNSFFNLNGIGEAERVSIASIHLEGQALEWFQGYKASESISSSGVKTKK